MFYIRGSAVTKFHGVSSGLGRPEMAVTVAYKLTARILKQIVWEFTTSINENVRKEFKL